MILNVSGRTDIVAFYTPWFINRYKEGFIDVRNPFNPNLVSRINFSDVDLILFCTKNPIPIIDYLKYLKKPIIFQITITPYKNDIEPNVPSKKEVINAVKKISEIIGSDNVYIRYDPIFLSDKYNLSYHIKAFKRLTTLLKGSTKHIIVSFLDIYKNVLKNKNVLNYQEFTELDYREIGLNFSKFARENDMSVQTCFEEVNLCEYGFIKEDCLSHTLAFKLTGKTYKNWTARKEKKCSCVSMVDIGVYNTCKHFCKYCYANFDEKMVLKNNQEHDPHSSLLIGHLKDSDIIKVRYK
ncbi:MAG: DUF1848 domain-containing protein [Bacilli bacterium]|nr:DUF1848 domain-containing protein [Bacilli bacterium]